jgi:ABC-type phosphate/phosphonate transport system substrate-binding protein
MAEGVKARTGIELKPAYFDLDEQLAASVGNGEVQAAIGKVWPILQGRQGASRPFERLADLPTPDGRNELSGAFIVRRDSSLSTLKDLAGKSLALGPGTAYEKSFAATAALREAGVTPGPVKVLDGCVPVAAAVYERSLDAGVVSSYVVDFNGLALVSDPGDFKVLARTKAMPFITFAVSATVDRGVRDRLRDALLEMHGQGLPQGLYSTGFTAPQRWEPPELEQK